MIPPFQLSQADSRPMYQQIVENVKRLILNGEWQSGQALPSIRELAVAVKVSVITVKRAYHELENEKIIITRHGLGSFVAPHGDVVVEQKRGELTEAIDQLIDLGQMLGLGRQELLQLIDARLKKADNKGENR